MRIKITPTTAAPKRPASPSGDSDDSSATQSTKKRRVRRPALSNDEDMAILRAVITLQPYRALWGQGRLKWQEAADHVTQQTGGEMSDELCKGRYVNLLKRYTTPQEDRKRPWPKDEQLKHLLKEALVLQTKWEEEVKDEVEEKPSHRRKWQPLQALGKLPSAAETATSSEARTQTSQSPLRQAAAGDGAGESAPPTLNAATAPSPSGTDTNLPPAAVRRTRWTAPTPGARAPVLAATGAPALPPAQTPVVSAGSPANPQAAALATRAVASATRPPAPGASSVSKDPSQAPVPSSVPSSRAPPTASHVSGPATSVPSSTSTPAPVSTAVATYVSTSTTRTSVTASVSTSTTRTSAPTPAPVPAASRALPTPAPWLASSGSAKPENTRLPGLTHQAPTPMRTPPRESKPQMTKSTPPPPAMPLSAASTVAGRGSSVRAMSVQEIVQNTVHQHGRPTDSARVTTSRQPASTPSTSPPSAPASASVSSSTSSSTVTLLSRPIPSHRGFPASASQYSHVRLNGSSLAPLGPSQARYIPLANAPFSMPVSSLSTRTTTVTVARKRESSLQTPVNNQTQPPRPQAPSGARVDPASAAAQPRTPDHAQVQGYAPARSIDAPRATTPPHGQAPTSIESTLFVVLDRLTAMENARLADTREEREFKRRRLEMEEAQRQHTSSSNNNHNNNSNSDTSNSASPSPSRGNQIHPHELDELRRTLTTSLTTSRQQQVDLEMEVGRLVPALQAGQRERGQLQVEILSLTTQLKGVQRERDDLKQDLSAVVKTMKQVQLAMQRQEDAFEDYKKADAEHRKRELDAQQATLTRQLAQFQDALQVDRRKREELLLSIQKEREYNQAQHRERLRELDVRAAALGDRRGGFPEATMTASTQQRPSRVEAELAELRIAIDVERSEREREYTTLLQNIKQIIAGDESA